MGKLDFERTATAMARRVGLVWGPTSDLQRVVQNALREACNDDWPDQTNRILIEQRVDQAAESGYLGPDALSPSQRRTPNNAPASQRHQYIGDVSRHLASEGSGQPRPVYDRLQQLAAHGSAYTYTAMGTANYVVISNPAHARQIQAISYENFRKIRSRLGLKNLGQARGAWPVSRTPRSYSDEG